MGRKKKRKLRQEKTFTGVVNHVKRRYCFVSSDEITDDIKIKSRDMKNAINGDKVLFKLLNNYNHKSFEGAIIKVIERSKNLIKKFPNIVPFYNYLGLSLEQTGKINEAENIFNKLNFTRMELYLCTFLIFCSLSLPYLFVSQNNKQISIYESETFNIFKAIDKNTNRVVTPKIQIDQLINQISLIPLAEIDNPISNFSNLNFLVSLGENYLKSALEDEKRIEFLFNDIDRIKQPYNISH